MLNTSLLNVTRNHTLNLQPCVCSPPTGGFNGTITPIQQRASAYAIFNLKGGKLAFNEFKLKESSPTTRHSKLRTKNAPYFNYEKILRTFTIDLKI